MKTVHVIRHMAFEGLGNIELALAKFDTNIKYIEAGMQPITEEILESDLLIVLGGPIGVYDVEDFPFLENEISLLKQRIEMKKPVLGVCLGAQLIAHAMGGRVYAGPVKEIGWGELEITAGDSNPLRHLTRVPILHWHGDTFELPEGATHLAGNHNYPNQAFAIDDHVLALQFHPEVTETSIERWFIGHLCEISATEGVSVKLLREDTAKYVRQMQDAADKVWLDWFKTINL
ncbi:glutamine amidotransferase [Aestuariibacter sp. AA17]|uniref:Glutamine amidotransferase n=1 Tax=Fluctibacter corallii TaxID=2984329 RepID=A0ABT3A7Q7_9ALTE|nr:glutamine amidotransferase [Aestuariibacter sp. AA17]MCV2884604.1 glutamine amidotransferase [Aestuariibacter sp. AA17]